MLQFKTRACKGCQTKHLCTKSKKGRVIERTEYTPCIEENQRKIEQNKELYKQRQSIVEHPFGTIKRQWGFYFIISKKGLARASADVGLMVTAYNLRRLMNILCIDVFREAIIASTLQLSLLLWLIRAKPSGVSLCRPSWAFLLKTVNTFFFHLYLGNDCPLNGGCETN